MSPRPRITSRPLASSRTYDTVGAKFLRKAAMIATATTMTACASTTKVEHKPLFNPDPEAKQASWEGQRYMFDHQVKVVQSEEEYKAVLLGYGPNAFI